MTTLTLRRYDDINGLFTLNTETFEFKEAAPEQGTPIYQIKAQGIAAVVDGIPFAVVSENGALRLFHKDFRCELREGRYLSKNIVLDHRRQFTLHVDGVEILSMVYERRVEGNMVEGLEPEEDNDFLLYLDGILNDPEKFEGVAKRYSKR